MQAVILAAGLGTRMGELTRDRPKPLLTIENKTLLEHNLLSLPDSVDEVVLVVGYLREQIKELVGDSFQGKRVRYVVQEEMKGTGHALGLCRDVLKGRFLVLMGDDLYSKEDLEKMARHPLAALVWELAEEKVKNGTPGLVKIDQNGKLVDIIERQPGRRGGLVNCAAYVIDERYFALPLVAAGNQKAEYGLPQTFLQLAKQGAVIDIVRASYWHKVTEPRDLASK